MESQESVSLAEDMADAQPCKDSAESALSEKAEESDLVADNMDVDLEKDADSKQTSKARDSTEKPADAGDCTEIQTEDKISSKSVAEGCTQNQDEVEEVSNSEANDNPETKNELERSPKKCAEGKPENDTESTTSPTVVEPMDTVESSQKSSKQSKKKNSKKSVRTEPLPTIDIGEFLVDNSRSLVLKGDVTDALKQEPCLLGIDEAGRGPVLGPMVYGMCFCPISKKDEMAALGFDDSKALTDEKREELLAKLLERSDLMTWMVHILSPNTISTSMLRRFKYNLNALSHDTAIGLIQAALDTGANITEVYVDTVGDPGKYQQKLKALFPQIDITVAKKADSTYPIVSAASICAKVVRDRIVEQWVCAEGVTAPESGYGSGYPGDEKTKKFLHSCIDPVFGFPQLVRFSWSTAAKILEDKACSMQWEDDDDDDDDVSGCGGGHDENAAASQGMSEMTKYFKSSGVTRTTNTSGALKRHAFFEDRRLYTVTGF